MRRAGGERCYVRGAREEILEVARDLCQGNASKQVELLDVVREMTRRGSAYSEATVRTPVTSRMCANSPTHHGTTYPDFRRLGRGTYELTS